MTGIEKRHWLSRNFSFEGLYYHICLYGESYSRPLIWTCLIITAATIYFFSENMNNISDLPFEEAFHLSWNKAVIRSISSLFPFFELQNNQLIDYTLRIILLPILATMFIGLRRKLERRFRH